MKDIKTLLLTLPLIFIGLTACDETDEAGEYDNWSVRNTVYLDSIAQVARANESGDWKIFTAYGINDTLQWGNQYHVYCQVIRQGDGTESPSYSDTVLVNYRGRLIPTKTYPDGAIFDESYLGQLDPEVNVPKKLNLSGCVRGWTTAMLHMVAGKTISSGDVWRVYIPATLGYGNRQDVSSIPPNSTLVFDLNLVAFYPIGTPVPDDY